MTNLIQALEAPTPAPEGNVDYVAWATEKFRNDDGSLNVAALARGKWEADTNHVPKLINELTEARKEAQTRASLADFMKEYEANRNTNTNTQVTTPVESTGTSSITQADIEKLVEAKLNHKQQEQAAQANVKAASDALKAKWGEHSKEKLEAKARELDVSIDFLQGVAIRSPKAFLELVLDKAPAAPPVAPGSYTPPRTNTNSNNMLNTNGGAKTRKQWNDERRKMKSSDYWTPEVQGRIQQDMVTLGDKFDH